MAYQHLFLAKGVHLSIHKITESQSMLSWKGPIKIIEYNSWPCTGHLKELHHASESIVQTLFEPCQVWCCDYSSGDPVPLPYHPLGEETFSNIKPEPRLTQLQAIPSSPVTDHHREEISVCHSSSV